MSGTHDTKQAIASALIELCEQKDFRKISVQDITKKSGLESPNILLSLYR